MRHKTPRVVHINENGRRRIDRGIDTGNRFNFPRLAVARDPAPAFSRGESFPPGTEGVGPINRDDRGDSAKIPKDQTPGSERDRSLRLSIRSNSSNFSPPPPSLRLSRYSAGEVESSPPVYPLIVSPPLSYYYRGTAVCQSDVGRRSRLRSIQMTIITEVYREDV